MKELKMIERVQNHLRLDDPVWIDKNDKNGFVSADMKVNEQSIQFLNSQISFIKGMNHSIQMSDILILKLYKFTQDKMEIQSTTIATGNSYFNRKQSVKIDHKIKEQGAYCLRLN